MSLRLLVAPKGGREVPSSRYRVHDLTPLLEQRGWTVGTLTPSTVRDRRLTNLARDASLALRGWDVLLVQRPGRRREELRLFQFTRPLAIAVDVDDELDPNPTLSWAIGHAQIVLAGSQRLAEQYGDGVRRVEVVPTAVDVSRYEQFSDVREPVVGWIGDGPAYRESLVRMVRGVGRAGPPWRLRIVGTRGDRELEAELRAAAAELPIELVSALNWTDEDAVAREVASFAVGLSPFRDSTGASFKTVQYLAAGVVPIVESGGEAERHVRTALGTDAPVAPPGDFRAIASALVRIADDRLRRALAGRCRATARSRYAREVVAARVDDLLREALAAATGRRR
jgi:glycosyltransferase involved in cell wall biosynthesis